MLTTERTIETLGPFPFSYYQATNALFVDDPYRVEVNAKSSFIVLSSERQADQTVDNADGMGD